MLQLSAAKFDQQIPGLADDTGAAVLVAGA